MNLNYTCICIYCGTIYRANRSRSKYCTTNHNSLYNANGSNIDFTILNSQNRRVSYHDVLSRLYSSIGDFRTWSPIQTYESLLEIYKYHGPLPDADELLLVSGYLIKKYHSISRSENFYLIKHMELLTKHEKASGHIISVDMYVLKEDY